MKLTSSSVRNPGCCVDVLLPSRGKSAYGINPNVRFTFVEELDGDPRPDEINAVVGKLRNKGYGKLISAKPAGANFSLQMAATTIPEKVSYISTEGYIFNWIANLVMKGERVPTMKMASLGASMYDLLWKLALDEDAPSEKRLDFRIPTNARESAKEKLEAQSLVPGKFALLQALPVPDTGAEPEACDWSKVGSNAKVPVVYVAKSKKEAKTYAGTNALVAPTVAELAALVDISVGVVCGNTPALQLGAALKKPLVLVSKDDKVAGTFVPGATVKTVSSPEAADSIIATW